MSKEANYYCYSLRMAGFLMQKGFVLLELREDYSSSRKIYIFRKSEELNEAIELYKTSK